MRLCSCSIEQTAHVHDMQAAGNTENFTVSVSAVSGLYMLWQVHSAPHYCAPAHTKARLTSAHSLLTATLFAEPSFAPRQPGIVLVHQDWIRQVMLHFDTNSTTIRLQSHQLSERRTARRNHVQSTSLTVTHTWCKCWAQRCCQPPPGISYLSCRGW